MTQLMLPLVILPDDTQHAHGSDDGMCQNLFEDDGRVQTLDKDGVSEGFDCSLSTTKVLEGSLCVPDKIFESSTDDEMNQPTSLFDTDSNIKTKVKTGHKRKVEEQEQLLKELISTDMAGKVQLKQAKGGQKRPSKVARLLNNNSGGLLGVASKVSAVSKISVGEAKDDGENQYAKLAATRARRDQVMGTPAVALCEKEDGASCPHSKGLTQHGLERSKHDFAPEKRKVCLPMVVEEGLSTVDAGNDHNSSQAEVATTKPKRILTAERKKKRQRKRHKKAYERRVGKIRVKPCIKKQTEKKPCHFYARGRCDKGVSCPFLHDITPITKSEICKYFINNCCLKGDDCPYSHALSTFPCKYFHTRGKCMEADSCQFSHEPISKEAKQKLLTKIEQEQVHEGNKATDRNSLGCIHPKYSVLPSDLELFPLGGKRGNRTPLKVTDAAASKMPHLDKIDTGSMSNTISKIPMLVAAKKAASTFIGGDTRVNAANLEMNKSMLHGSLLDPTGFLADKSSAIRTTKSAPRETGLPLVQTIVLSRDSTTTQERKIKIDAFLQEQLNTSHLMRKPTKLGMGSESSGGCFMLLNQPRAMSMGQTSLLKAPNTSASRDRNAKAMMGSPHASVDHSHLTPTSKPTICAGNKPKSDFSIDQGKGFPNEESVGIDASVPNPSVLGPSLLDLVSTPQRATFPKGPTASTSGLLSPTIDATSKEVQPVLFWIGF